MTDSAINENAIKTMVAINAAIRNMRLYPITSAATINSVNKAFHGIAQYLDTEDALAYAESEKNLLISGKPLSEKEQQKPQIIAFLDILLNFRVKNLVFQKGISQEEFTAFLQVLLLGPGEVVKAGGLKTLIAQKQLTHILIDEKIFVSVEENQQVASKDDVRKKLNLEETFAPMVSTLDAVLEGEYKDKVSKHLAASMVKKDDDVLGAVLTQKTEGELGEKLFVDIIESLGDDKFERLIYRIKQIYDEVQKSGRKISDAEFIRQTYQSMLKSVKGERLQAKLRERKTQDKVRREQHKVKILSGINSLLKGEQSAFHDKDLMQAIPAAIAQMFSKGQSKAVEVVLARLCEGLSIKIASVRAAVADALASSLEKLPEDARKEMLTQMIPKLAHWISRKTALTPAVEKIGKYLAEKAGDILQHGRFAQSDLILKAFYSARYGKTEKEQNFREFAGNMLKSIPDDTVINKIIHEFQYNEEGRRDQAGKSMVFLADSFAEPLLDILKQSQHRSERARILQVISDMGAAAIPSLTQRIQEGKPWYFMRNIVLLFGKTGNETHLDIIRPFLSHDDYRVQREALNSIYNIGGKQREEIFLSVLPNAGDQLKTDIVGMIGATEYRAAVPMLIQILESKPMIPSKTRNELEEKICTILGNVIAEDAIPVLMSIADPKKSVLSKISYSDKVQAAARKAVQKIRAGRTAEK
jgi:HEAT repeat protein